MRSFLLPFLLIACSSSGEQDNTSDTMGSGGAGALGGAGGAGANGSAGSGAVSCEPTSVSTGTPMLTCTEIASLGVCGECIDEKCCELADICTVDADCACMVECIGPSLSLTTDCLATCGLTGSPPGFSDLATCAATACANFGVGGECTVPTGFQPPPDMAAAAPTSGAGIGSGDLADCSFGAADPSGSVLQLQSEDGTICVRIERRNDGSGSLANIQWTLLNMRVGPLGEVVLIDEPADLCWYSSHHNFNDWAHAGSGSRYYEMKMSFTGHGATPTYELYVFQAGPSTTGGCAPVSDGVCPIATLDLVPVP